MTQYMFRPICHYCKHFDRNVIKSDRSAAKCKAFPDDIPLPISTLEYDHREPYEGDNGITFEKYDDLTSLEDYIQAFELRDVFLELTFRVMDKMRVEGRTLPPLDPKALQGKLSYEEYFKYYVQMGQQKSAEIAVIPPSEATASDPHSE